jgi:hypothetical protein
MKRRPNPRITNAAKKAERKYYQRLPRRSRRIKEAKLLAIRRDCSLSVAQKNQLFLQTKYRLCFPDRSIPLVTIGSRHYQETGVGYLSELTHAGYLSEVAYRNADPVLIDAGAEGE